MSLNIALLCGSLRKGSYSSCIASFLLSEASVHNFNMQLVEIENLAFYNEDLDTEGNVPAAWQAFRNTLKDCDGFIFITPEYNRSVPAVLKNAVDVGSRPWDQNVWTTKPAAVISHSIGGVGGFGANHHLRQSLACLNAAVMAQPEAYLGEIGSSFDEHGNICNENTKDFLQRFLRSYKRWCDKIIK